MKSAIDWEFYYEHIKESKPRVYQHSRCYGVTRWLSSYATSVTATAWDLFREIRR